VSAMRREVHRMELRKAELERQTERLMQVREVLGRWWGQVGGRA
jgi:hypothetical protein